MFKLPLMETVWTQGEIVKDATLMSPGMQLLKLIRDTRILSKRGRRRGQCGPTCVQLKQSTVTTLVCVNEDPTGHAEVHWAEERMREVRSREKSAQAAKFTHAKRSSTAREREDIEREL